MEPRTILRVVILRSEVNMKPLTVGQLAKRAGVNVETLRYYERIRMMPKPERKPSGYRMYSEEDFTQLAFIRHAKVLGFTLNEIKELLELRVDAKSNCEEVRAQTEAKIHDIDQKIVYLQRIREVLTKLADACHHRKDTGECPILDAIESEVF